MKYDMVLYYYGGRSLQKLQNMLTPFLKRSFFCRRGIRRSVQTQFLSWWLQVTCGWYFGKEKMYFVRDTK